MRVCRKKEREEKAFFPFLHPSFLLTQCPAAGGGGGGTNKKPVSRAGEMFPPSFPPFRRRRQFAFCCHVGTDWGKRGGREDKENGGGEGRMTRREIPLPHILFTRFSDRELRDLEASRCLVCLGSFKDRLRYSHLSDRSVLAIIGRDLYLVLFPSDAAKNL